MSDQDHPAESVTLLNECASSIMKRFPNIFPPDYPAFRSPERAYFSDPSKLCAGPPVRHFAVERLVEEIGVLLSRCMQGRDAKLDLEARALEFWLEVELADQRDALRRQQIANGEYTLSGTLADIERQMQSEALNATDSSLKARQTAVAIRTAGNSTYQERVDNAAEVASLSAFSNFKAVEISAKKSTASTIDFEKVGAMAEEFATSASAALHRRLRESAEKRYEVESANAPLRTSIFETEVNARAKRVAIAISPNVGLNYKQRFEEIQKVLEQDLGNLCRRLRALEVAMQTQYGIAAPLPDLATSSLTDLAIWARARIEEFWNISEAELHMSASISVKTRVGPAAWEQILLDGKGLFTVPLDLFGSLRCVRLRRVRAYVVSPTIGNWSAIFHAPGAASWRCTDDTVMTMDQTMAGPICLATIGVRTSATEDSECTGRGLDGLSPVGEWKLEIQDYSDSGEPRSAIEDLVVAFDVTAIS